MCIRDRAWLFENQRATTECGEGNKSPGSAAVSLVVAPSGRVGGVVFSDEALAPPVRECVKRALKALRFPSYTGEMEPARTYKVPVGKRLPSAPAR